MTTLDLTNVQGDILLALFRSSSLPLAQDVPIKPGSFKDELVPVVGINIAFSQFGLTKPGFTDDIGDPAFKKGRLAGAEDLKDDLDKWNAVFEKDTSFVVVITGDSHFSIDKEEQYFPSPATWTDANPEPLPVRPGVVLLGRDGDGLETPRTRPAWAHDGSFLIFRCLLSMSSSMSLENRRIIRHGVAFWPEIIKGEARSKKTAHARGLLVVYTNLASWTASRNSANAVRVMSGVNCEDPSKNTPLPQEWVITKGGEYSSSPLIKSLKERKSLGIVTQNRRVAASSIYLTLYRPERTFSVVDKHA
ncbi:hypothetical protein FISHEDRAFT_57906 [Fistulina hepatica ATCC 64428]|uniref:DyP dimeric alpha+beta barrel domain-containing protein n=1 Tax=Fistulina hepatica ATCC 64428 TaxID=1128425 RepID=A0A0D7AER4_9AGAR|nr:hypothetical protein FISHEDRAFT_57906 [Fistulina hepatica ATCC 64428]